MWAHAEGKDWRNELDVFLLAYRSTPHCISGRRQAELLVNHQIRTSWTVRTPAATYEAGRCCTCSWCCEEGEGTCKCKQSQKSKRKHGETGRQSIVTAAEAKQTLRPYERHTYTVINRKGQSVIIEKDGKKMMRHVSLVKRWVESEQDNAELNRVTGPQLISHTMSLDSAKRDRIIPGTCLNGSVVHRSPFRLLQHEEKIEMHYLKLKIRFLS